MSTQRTKAFIISDNIDLEKVDKWWAGLLRKSPKEITSIEWVPNGDLVWILKLTWAKLETAHAAFNVCMPAYSGFSIEELQEVVEASIFEKSIIKNNLKLFKTKLDDWEIIETADYNHEYDEYNSSVLIDFSIDPTLSYASKLDVVDKIMVSEFLWPYYKSLRRSLLMCEARIEEIKKEIENRSNPEYTIVRVDRGMLRTSFIEQVGYDNKWLFATDDELLEDYMNEESDEDNVD